MANEKRLIDANAIPYEEHYVPDGDTQWEYKKVLCVLKPTIDAMPTVDAVEVVHGRWIDKENPQWRAYDIRHCSVCGWNIPKTKLRQKDAHWNFCPNCGAKMDGDGNAQKD